jgi:hypothetical protein
MRFYRYLPISAGIRNHEVIQIRHRVTSWSAGACCIEMLGNRIGIRHALPPCRLPEYSTGGRCGQPARFGRVPAGASALYPVSARCVRLLPRASCIPRLATAPLPSAGGFAHHSPWRTRISLKRAAPAHNSSPLTRRLIKYKRVLHKER